MTLRHGGKPVERVAADANVLLSAAAGRAVLRIFAQTSLEVLTTSSIITEVGEYLPLLAEKYGITRAVVECQFGLLNLREYGPEEYRKNLGVARKRIGRRDPDDIDLLALALKLKVPLWTNDRDFEGTGVECYTTARLLKILGI